jgi:hypothetical protein
MSLWKYYSNINLEKIRKGINSMLYCAAKIDENNIVIDTIVVDESDISDENGVSDSALVLETIGIQIHLSFIKKNPMILGC